MATIYLAKIAGPAGFEKPLALKVIHTHLVEDPQFVQMFFDEARIASQLQHPNIVQIFELGESNGIYFIAMEYLRGENVGTVIQRVHADGTRTMDPRVACHIIMEAAEGLHYAHELTALDGQPLRLVHRDISPQNLFVTFSGAVKLMDFGIARAVGLAHSTRPGSLKGKFSYMSPEQVRGRDIDHRSDIFGLGVVLWEMLTGRRLFKGRNDLESLRLAGEAKVTPVGQLRTGIPPELDRVLVKALAKEPDERYGSALDFHTDLSLVMDRLGSPMITHELARRMRDWFAAEVEKKRQLLIQTIPMNSQAGEGAGPPTLHAAPSIDITPSVSEPSGVRIREIAGLAADNTTPSQSGAWNPGQLNESQPMAQTVAIDGGSLPGYASYEDPAPSFSSISGLAYEDESVHRRRRWLKIFAIVWALLFGIATVAVGVVLLLGYVTPGGDDDTDHQLIGANKSGRSATPDVANKVPQPQPVKIEEPTKAGDAAAVPAANVGASSANTDDIDGTNKQVSEPVEEMVKLSLTVNVASANVTVDGHRQDDPAEIALPRSSEPVKVVVSAPRHMTESFTITPDRDVTRHVALRRRVVEPPRKQGKRPTRDNDLINSPYR